MFKKSYWGIALMLLLTATAFAATGINCFTVSKIELPIDEKLSIYQAIEAVRSDKDLEDASLEVIEQWVAVHASRFENPSEFGIKIANNGEFVSATLILPDGSTIEIIITGPYRPLPEGLPYYVGAGQMIDLGG